MTRSTSHLRFWAALALMLALLQGCITSGITPDNPTGTYPAQSAPYDSGEYQILQARYGTASYNVDVTPRLRELARRDRAFRLGNDTLGVDPHPNNIKTLRIFARGRDGQTRTFEYREGSQVDGAVFVGWGGGNWGGSGQGGWTGGWGGTSGPAPVLGQTGTPGIPGRADSGEFQILQARYGTAERNVDVTQRLKELARQDQRFGVGNASFGVDPHPNQTKTLRIFSRGRDGQNRTFEYAEGSTVDGSQFTGWGGGNWGQGSWNGGWGASSTPQAMPPPPAAPPVPRINPPGFNRPAVNNQLNIISASYGDGTRVVDVTQRLRARVQDDRLDVYIDNNFAGTDPAPRTIKTLWVTYSVGSGAPQRVQLREFDQLQLP